MSEREPVPTVEGPTRPSYAQIGQGLERLLTAAGGKVAEGFPSRMAPKGATTDYDHATTTLILHPWISPRARSEALLKETVRRLTDKQSTKRGKQAEESRSWAVESTVAGYYGLAAREEAEDVELSVFERTLVDHILASVEDVQAVAEPTAPDTRRDADSETVFEAPKPRRKRAKEQGAEGVA